MTHSFRSALVVAVAAATLAAAVTRVSRESMRAMEISFDKRIQTIAVDNPFELLGNTRGVYLDNYGAVFTAEVNLQHSATISPFMLTIPKGYAAKLRQSKLSRLPVVRQNMQEEMLAMAASLDGVPPKEQIVLGVTLYYHKWEETNGLPAQIVMRAERQKLLDVQLGGTDRSSLDSIIRVDEQ